MTIFLWFLVTLACAAIGGIIAAKLKLPAGAMLGSMIAVIAFNLLTEKGFFYSELKIVIQFFAGALIGSKVGKDDLIALKKIICPSIILIVAMIILNIGFGSAIVAFSDLDVPTSLFATTPGGISDMALISQDLGANTGYVAILQAFRVLIILIFCPPIFKKIMHKHNLGTHYNPTHTAKKTSSKIFELKNFLLLSLCAVVVGIIFWQLGITAGAMIGGMVGGAIFTIFTHKVYFPKTAQCILQIFAGAFVGVQMNKESLKHLDILIIPILIMLVGILVFIFATSFVMHKCTKLDFATCMFASTPGGLQEISLLSEDMGADTVKVAVMQTLRLVFVISFFPLFNKIIIGLLG